jgi:hypothetical protein
MTLMLMHKAISYREVPFQRSKYIHMHTCMYSIHLHICIYVYLYIHIYIYIYIYTHTHIYAHIHRDAHTFKCMYAYVCMHTQYSLPLANNLMSVLSYIAASCREPCFHTRRQSRWTQARQVAVSLVPCKITLVWYRKPESKHRVTIECRNLIAGHEWQAHPVTKQSPEKLMKSSFIENYHIAIFSWHRDSFVYAISQQRRHTAARKRATLCPGRRLSKCMWQHDASARTKSYPRRVRWWRGPKSQGDDAVHHRRSCAKRSVSLGKNTRQTLARMLGKPKKGSRLSRENDPTASECEICFEFMCFI